MFTQLLKRASFLVNDDKAAVPDWMADLTLRSGGDGSSAKEKAERDARWVGEFADELTVAIALRDWDQAVSLVQQGQSFRTSHLYHNRPEE